MRKLRRRSWLFALGFSLLPAALLLLLLPSLPAIAQSGPAVPQSSMERLILKDGSYQIVTQYKIVENRVRFYSAERADWEEIPKSLVNWPATKEWNEHHGMEAASAGSVNSEAAALDREEQQERTETPAVAPGLTLPNQMGVWALDIFDGNPELVQLVQDTGDVNQRSGHNIDRQSFDREGGLKKRIEMNGGRSKVQLHVSQPAFYVSLTVPNLPPGPDAFTVNVHDASVYNTKNSGSSPNSEYVIVRVFSNYRHNFRVVSAIHIPRTGPIAATADVIPTIKKVLPGGNWMELKPAHPLRIGEYALMEILGPGEYNGALWDFRIDPQGPENQDAIRSLKQLLNQP